MLKFIFICVGLLIPICSYADEHTTPFTSEGLNTLKGKDICSIEGEFSGELGVYLDGHKDYSVVYRERDGVIAAFLLSHPTNNCGKVEAVLNVTKTIKKEEFIEFQCYTKHEGGTGWEKWGHVIGLVNNDKGNKRFVTARVAWRVNVEKKRFEKISKKTECDTIGYADGE
ncbi:MAG: hypothetical protein ABL869_03015 [Candidatus Nitrotoga sp.]